MAKRNPLIRRKEKSYSTPLPNQSAGILDDFAVRKVISSKEGTITKTPVNDIDITNKAYVDSMDFWQRVGTAISPKTITDFVGIGTTTPDTLAHVHIDPIVTNADNDFMNFTAKKGLSILQLMKFTAFIPGIGTTIVKWLIGPTGLQNLDFSLADGDGVSKMFLKGSNDFFGFGTTNPKEKISIAGNISLPKASGNGIKVDLTTPTFGFRDLLGQVTTSNTGATKPTHAIYRDTLRAFQFAAGDEEYFEFHIPHDYVAGTDIFLHYHWSHNSALVTGGNAVFEYETSYAKGHNRGAFPASVSGTVTGNASTTQYQHMLDEIQLSAASPSGSQIDSDDLEPDGIILMRAGLQTNNITSSGAVPDPFIHYVDIHYQSTNIATKSKSPDFYT